MSWVTDNRKHRNELASCTIVDTPDNFHFELKCEDCDVKRMSRLSMDVVGDLYRQGRVTQDDFEAFTYVFDLLSPYRGTPSAPANAGVRRIARKLLAVRSFDVPTELQD